MLSVKQGVITNHWGCPRGVLVKAMDSEIIVSEFVLKSCYYVHFRTSTLGKGMKPLILPGMGEIVPLLFFEENGLGIKKPTNVDMLLNKETKPNVPFFLYLYDLSWYWTQVIRAIEEQSNHSCQWASLCICPCLSVSVCLSVYIYIYTYARDR